MKNLDPKRARWIRFRMGALSGLMALGLGGIVSSAYHVQVEDHAAWREAAEAQRQRRLHVEPKRGAIYDRSGAPLAVSVEVPSVSADVVEMLRGVGDRGAEDRFLADASVRIATALSLDARDVEAKLLTRRRFLWLKRRVTSDEAAAVRKLGDARESAPHKPIRGLAIDGEGHRYYPGRELAGPLLGFVAPDGFGKEGLELSLDEQLRGRVEEVKGLRDRAGRLVFSEGATSAEALSGSDVTLSIDQAIQHLAERELDSAMKTYETNGASIVVLDPRTGEILALASSPGYNPNDYAASDVDARRNRVVTDRFEPGSVMKVFTVAAALEEGKLKPTDSIFCERGSYQMGKVTIHDTHVNEWLSPTQILAKSSNIGSLKIALRLGEPGLYAAFRRFGFGEATAVPVPTEARGVLRPKGRPWFDIETANASFGQGVSVTTLQLATAMGAIANGGKLMDPILVRRIKSPRGETVREWSPHARREAVRPATAQTVTEMLTAVVEDGGTGVEAAVPGFRVAGKTATAQKVDPATGRYSEDKYTASFVGFVPAKDPKLVIAVVLDEPMIGRYGGDLAGPVFRRVAIGALRYLGVTSGRGQQSLEGITREGDPADAILAAAKPAAAPPPPAPMTVGPPLPASARVPDVQGFGARDAVRAVTAAGLVPEIEGSGKLVRQHPPPGSQVAKGSAVRLVLEPGS